LQLYVKDTSSSQLFDTICSNQFKTFNGINRNSSGVYRDTLINSIGCDSFLYLNLFVKPTTSSSRNITICANQSYFFKGQSRTTPGVYYDTIPNSRGCDSFITLNLFVNTLSYRTIDTTICNGKTFFFKGQNRTMAGTFRDTLLNFNGCDSFVTLIIAFKDTSYYSYSDTICQNKPLLFNGLFRNVAGNYKDTLINAKGCDSFVYLNLFVKNTSTTLLRDTICANSFYSFKGLNLNNPGVYRDTLINTQGCDSFIILTLIVLPTTSSNRTINICQGQSYIFKGKSEVTSGTYLDTLKNQYGCDSFVRLNLIVNPLPIANAGIDQTRVNCDGDSTRLGTNPIPDYGYLWSPSIGLPTVSAANPYTKTIIKTTYSLLVTNIITGCQSRDTVEIDIIQSQLNGSANAKDLRCHNDFSGQLNIKASNGYSPYYYKVDYMTSYSTSSLISNLSATPSSIFTIKDNKGCLFSDTFTIKQPAPIVINKLEQSDLKCFNDNSGKITVSVNGGTPPYQLSWDRSTSNDTIAEKLSSGIHIFTIRDDSLCSKSRQFVLNEPKQISLLDTVIQKNPCFGDALGKIKAIAIGGLLPYQYKWSSGQSGQEISQLKQGQYTLTLLDKNLCSDTVVLFIKDPGKLEFTFNKPSLDCRNLARLSIKANEGTSPYFYSINNGLDYTRDSNFWINKIGHYKLSVRDNNGCLANDSLDIDYVKLLKINVIPSKKVIALSESVQLSFRVIEGDSSQIQSLIWTPSTGLNCSDCEAPLAAPYSSEVYTLNVKYANDCETRGQANIIVDGNNELFIPTAIYPFSEKLENTSFKIYTNNVLRAYLSIYNRWGEKLFETTEPHKNGWTGEYKGELSTSGVYYYYLEITYLDGRKVVKKGEINLIR
jgi:gliding motility-associated-like protein